MTPLPMAEDTTASTYGISETTAPEIPTVRSSVSESEPSLSSAAALTVAVSAAISTCVRSARGRMASPEPWRSNSSVHSSNSSPERDPDSERQGTQLHPPSKEEARRTYEDLQSILKPKRKNGPGHVDPGFDPFTREQLEQLRQFLWNYTDPDSTAHGLGNQFKSSWKAASNQTAHALTKGDYLARNL